MKNEIEAQAEYMVRTKRYVLLIFVFGIATCILGLLIISVPFLTIYNTEFQFRPELLVFAIAFLLLLNYTLWLIYGYEKLIVFDNVIHLIRSNGIIRHKKIIQIQDIVAIEVTKSRHQPSRQKMFQKIQEEQRAYPFWIKMGQLILKTKTYEQTFFNGLSDQAAVNMKIKLDFEIQKRKIRK